MMTDNDIQEQAKRTVESVLSRCESSEIAIVVSLSCLRSLIASCPDGAKRVDLFEYCVTKLRSDLAIDQLINPVIR